MGAPAHPRWDGGGALMILFVVRLMLTIWIALAFRVTLGPRLAIAGVQPDLAAGLVFYLTLRRGAGSGSSPGSSSAFW